MKTLQIEEKKAKELYKTASTEFRAMLEDTFGRDFFKIKITDRVKTFEDTLAMVGASDNVRILLDYNGYDKDMISHKAHAKLTIIARALNEGWTPDWENSSEYKYYPWFKIKSGFAFSHTYYVYTITGTDVGSRLCYRSEKLAEYAGKQFENIYKDFLI